MIIATAHRVLSLLPNLLMYLEIQFGWICQGAHNIQVCLAGDESTVLV